MEAEVVTTYGRSESVRSAITLAGDGIRETRRIPSLNGSTPDNPADIGAALDGCDIVLLGCTAFLADGSMAADAGTLALVEAAAKHDPPVPVHFFADTLKLAPWLPETQGQAPSPNLDIIPAEYVDHVITEDGIRRPGQLLQAAADLASWWRMLETPEG